MHAARNRQPLACRPQRRRAHSLVRGPGPRLPLARDFCKRCASNTLPSWRDSVPPRDRSVSRCFQRSLGSLLRTCFTSMIGVPSTASRSRTRILLPSTAATSTRCSPIGFGRAGERVRKTPSSGLDASPRGCTRSTSRRARWSHVKTMSSSPARIQSVSHARLEREPRFRRAFVALLRRGRGIGQRRFHCSDRPHLEARLVRDGVLGHSAPPPTGERSAARLGRFELSFHSHAAVSIPRPRAQAWRRGAGEDGLASRGSTSFTRARSCMTAGTRTIRTIAASTKISAAMPTPPGRQRPAEGALGGGRCRL